MYRQQAPYYCEATWTEEALMIPKDNVTEWEIDWEWLYSSLSAGGYRLGKEIMDFRGPGDYDTQMIYVEFEIK